MAGAELGDAPPLLQILPWTSPEVTKRLCSSDAMSCLDLSASSASLHRSSNAMSFLDLSASLAAYFCADDCSSRTQRALLKRRPLRGRQRIAACRVRGPG